MLPVFLYPKTPDSDNPIAHPRTSGKKKPAISSGFCTSLDLAGLSSGGGGGNRTPALLYNYLFLFN